jgi:hypothetical protein
MAMRFRTWTPAAVFTAVLTAVLALLPASPAAAQPVLRYRVAGAEVFATAEEGVFVGTATRRNGGVGTWYADVLHHPLTPDGKITGGSFAMALTARPHVISGEFTGGLVDQVDPGEGCTNQLYDVTGSLDAVAGGRSTDGLFKVRLTHHRLSILGRCTTYGATVVGSVRFG